MLSSSSLYDTLQYYRSYYDLGEEWSSRIDQISRVRVAGPALISVGLMIKMVMRILRMICMSMIILKMMMVGGPALISVSFMIMMILRMIMPGWQDHRS